MKRNCVFLDETEWSTKTWVKNYEYLDYVAESWFEIVFVLLFVYFYVYTCVHIFVLLFKGYKAEWLMKTWVENDKYANYAAESWCQAQKQCKRSSSHLLRTIYSSKI